VKRQEWADRREALDRIEKTEDGKEIEWRAFERYVDRSLARFEWNFETDTAMLQVSECGKRGSKGALTEAVSSFKALVEPWMPIDTLFSPIDLPRAIARLHEGEETGRREIRYVAIDYTVAGRRVTGRSSSRLDPLLGEKAVDLALHDMRRAGTAQGGNFYWLPRPGTPFDGEIHTHIAGEEGWVYFPADHQTEDCVRYIIGRLRALAE
ncbi:MAG TPA: hypothetical protein VH877_27355, partial [Polyangia bacterium]|nr:hypothetical protein [Polyangia bacterium]